MPMAQLIYGISSDAIVANEYDYHSHMMPDGKWAVMHQHAGGNVIHSHRTLQMPDGSWEYAASDPILSAYSPQMPAAVDPMDGLSGTYTATTEPEEPPKSRSDIIWELLKGAAKQ